jgi:hypothetical protein
MKADAQQLIFLKSLLKSFADSIGLRVNYRKISNATDQCFKRKNSKTGYDLWMFNWYPSFHLSGLANGNNQTKV